MHRDQFGFELPPHLIAQRPAPRRDASRLLVVERFGTALRDGQFPDIVELVPPGDLMVFNSTRVRHARLVGRRSNGRRAEVLLIHPATDDTWIAMGSPGSALRPGKRIALDDDHEIETVEILDDGMRRVRFLGSSADEAIARFGAVPLPPYINRPPEAADAERYQTVYSLRTGSVAAPTAGLHFTSELLQRLRERGVTIGMLDLEVGPGTFRPLADGEVSDHVMHAESFEIPDALAGEIAACRQRAGKVWAVGTTVVRALESAVTSSGEVIAGRGETRLMVMPGFEFRVVDRLLTNFHLPHSTLLMLVAAFAGHETTMRAYRHAVEQAYRFYSYGDAMVVI